MFAISEVGQNIGRANVLQHRLHRCIQSRRLYPLFQVLVLN